MLKAFEDEALTELQTKLDSLDPREKGRQYLIQREQEAEEKYAPPGVEFFKSLIPGQIEPAPEEAPDAVSTDLGLIDPIETLIDMSPLAAMAGLGLKTAKKALPESGLVSKLRETIETKMGNRAAPQEIESMLKGAGVKREEIEDTGIETWLREMENKLFDKQKSEIVSSSQADQDVVDRALNAPNATPKIEKTEVLSYLDEKQPELEVTKLGTTSLSPQKLKETRKKIRELKEKQSSLIDQSEILQNEIRKKLFIHSEKVLSEQKKEVLKEIVPLLDDRFFDKKNLQEVKQKIDTLLEDVLNEPDFVNHRTDFFKDQNNISKNRLRDWALRYNTIKIPRKESGSFSYMKPSSIEENFLYRNFRDGYDLKSLNLSDELFDLFEKNDALIDEVSRKEINIVSLQEFIGIKPTKWKRIGLSEQGFDTNYRELIFTVPGPSKYRSYAHWGEKVENPLFHVRAQDIEAPEVGRALNVDELQSDWHQAGQKGGYEGTVKPDKQNLWTVPDAPFKKSWTKNAMRRMLKEAIDGDYDSLTWTAGMHQAGRAGQVYKLEEGIGKFYDQRLVNEMNDEIKKYGGRVEKVTVTAPNGKLIDLWRIKITDKMRDTIKEKGQPLYAIPAAVGLGEVVREMKKEQESKKSY